MQLQRCHPQAVLVDSSVARKTIFTMEHLRHYLENMYGTLIVCDTTTCLVELLPTSAMTAFQANVPGQTI